MKFAKVVILASALAVSAFPQIAHSQGAATPETSQASNIAEWSKNVGKHCTVFSSTGDKPCEGNLQSLTNSYIFVEKPTRMTVEGKTFIASYVTRIPMKNVTRVSFEQPAEKK